MELRSLTVKESERPNLITVLLVIKLHFGLLFFFKKKEELMKAQTIIRVSGKAKHLNGNSEQGLFHTLAKHRMSYSRLL